MKLAYFFLKHHAVSGSLIEKPKHENNENSNYLLIRLNFTHDRVYLMESSAF